MRTLSRPRSARKNSAPRPNATARVATPSALELAEARVRKARQSLDAAIDARLEAREGIRGKRRAIVRQPASKASPKAPEPSIASALLELRNLDAGRREASKQLEAGRSAVLDLLDATSADGRLEAFAYAMIHLQRVSDELSCVLSASRDVFAILEGKAGDQAKQGGAAGPSSS